MKSAEEVANKLQNAAFELWVLNKPKELYPIIVSALNAFAEERVEESELRTTNQMMVRVLPNMIAKARAEAFDDGWNKALEEALKVADLAPGTNGRTIAKEIRALK